MSSLRSQFEEVRSLLDQVHTLINSASQSDVAKASSILKSILPLYKAITTDPESKKPENYETLKEIKVKLTEETNRVIAIRDESKKQQDTINQNRSIEITKPTPLGGYLKKLGEKGIVKSYKKRWFQQKDTKLYYYEKEGDTNSFGFINLPDMLSVKTVDSGFELATPGRTYNLQVFKSSDLSYWIEGLNNYKKYYVSLQNSLKNQPSSSSSSSSVKPSAPTPTANNNSFIKIDSSDEGQSPSNRNGSNRDYRRTMVIDSSSPHSSPSLSKTYSPSSSTTSIDGGTTTTSTQQPNYSLSTSYQPTTIEDGLKKREAELRKKYEEEQAQKKQDQDEEKIKLAAEQEKKEREQKKLEEEKIRLHQQQVANEALQERLRKQQALDEEARKEEKRKEEQEEEEQRKKDQELQKQLEQLQQKQKQDEEQRIQEQKIRELEIKQQQEEEEEEEEERVEKIEETQQDSTSKDIPTSSNINETITTPTNDTAGNVSVNHSNSSSPVLVGSSTPVPSRKSGNFVTLEQEELKRKMIEDEIRKKMLEQQDQMLDIERQRREALDREIKKLKDQLEGTKSSQSSTNNLQLQIQLRDGEIDRLKKEVVILEASVVSLEKDKKELSKPAESFPGEFSWSQEISKRDKKCLDLQYRFNEMEESLKLKENAVAVIKRENEILREETEKKDKYITELIERNKNNNNQQQGRNSSTSVSVDVNKLKESLYAHQTQNGFLLSEIKRLEAENQLKLEIKNDQIKQIQLSLADSINNYGQLRDKLFHSSSQADYCNKLEKENQDIKKEYFLSLAVSIKLHRSLSGEPSNVDVATLYEDAIKTSVPINQWAQWLSNRYASSK